MRRLARTGMFRERLIRKVSLWLMALLLPLGPALAGCRAAPQKYSSTFTGSFDTVIQIIGYAADQDTFDHLASLAEERFEQMHRLFDIYHEYEGQNNLRTVNLAAGYQPVQVDPLVIELLQFCLDKGQLAPGTVNIAFGPVLEVWRRYREAALAGGTASIPSLHELEQAALLCDPSWIQINEDEQTVFLTKAGMALDVGAVAKGFATERVAAELAAAGLVSGIVSAGGSNVRLISSPADGRRDWQIGIQNPFGNPLIPDDPPLCSLLASDTSIVTSGDYQRYYTVDGTAYHHLIDTSTLMPARHFRSVTVMTPDSGLADFLSTAVFLLPYAQGRALVESLPECEALWVMPGGSLEMTPGMQAAIKD